MYMSFMRFHDRRKALAPYPTMQIGSVECLMTGTESPHVTA
jgi:hypothetical protein